MRSRSVQLINQTRLPLFLSALVAALQIPWKRPGVALVVLAVSLLWLAPSVALSAPIIIDNGSAPPDPDNYIPGPLTPPLQNPEEYQDGIQIRNSPSGGSTAVEVTEHINWEYIHVFGTSELNITSQESVFGGGATGGGVYMRDDSTLYVNAGDDAVIAPSSVVETDPGVRVFLNSGRVYGLYGSAYVEQSGGYVSFKGYSGTVNSYGGELVCDSCFNGPQINLSGTVQVNQISLHGGSLVADGPGVVFTENIFLENSHFELRDAAFAASANLSFLSASGDIYGGRGLRAIEIGTHSLPPRVTIYGSSFALDGVPLQYGVLSDLSGNLTGILSSGDLLDTSITVYPDSTLTLAPIPEPSTALLMGLGLTGLGLRQRRRATIVLAGGSHDKATVLL